MRVAVVPVTTMMLCCGSAVVLLVLFVLHCGAVWCCGAFCVGRVVDPSDTIIGCRACVNTCVVCSVVESAVVYCLAVLDLVATSQHYLCLRQRAHSVTVCCVCRTWTRYSGCEF